MFELLMIVVAIALIGSLGVPMVVLSLARFGYFEPIRFYAFARWWNFSPTTVVSKTATGATILAFPHETVFASAVTAAYTVLSHTGHLERWQQQETRAAASGYVRDVRRLG
jgi:hypothetical protein